MATAESNPSDREHEPRFLPTRQSLLSRLRDLGDDISWRDFFDTYWKLIYSTATKAGLSDAEAQDVVQETILTVTRAIGDFKYDPARGSFKSWLLHTTRWRILDHLRRQKSHPRANLEPTAGRDTDLIEQVPDLAGDCVAQIWETEWEHNLLEGAMQRIKRQVNPKHYQVFELYVLKKWPATKVATTLDVNLAQVHLIKHRIGRLVKKEVCRLKEQGI